jgi:hypothetical protein
MTIFGSQVGLGSEWARRHHRPVIVVRVLLSFWILFIIVYACATDHWWGLVFSPFLVLNLWLLRNLVLYARAQSR